MQSRKLFNENLFLSQIQRLVMLLYASAPHSSAVSEISPISKIRILTKLINIKQSQGFKGTYQPYRHRLFRNILFGKDTVLEHKQNGLVQGMVHCYCYIGLRLRTKLICFKPLPSIQAVLQFLPYIVDVLASTGICDRSIDVDTFFFST